jgi:hypothetical protein
MTFDSNNSNCFSCVASVLTNGCKELYHRQNEVFKVYTSILLCSPISRLDVGFEFPGSGSAGIENSTVAYIPNDVIGSLSLSVSPTDTLAFHHFLLPYYTACTTTL